MDLLFTTSTGLVHRASCISDCHNRLQEVLWHEMENAPERLSDTIRNRDGADWRCDRLLGEPKPEADPALAERVTAIEDRLRIGAADDAEPCHHVFERTGVMRLHVGAEYRCAECGFTEWRPYPPSARVKIERLSAARDAVHARLKIERDSRRAATNEFKAQITILKAQLAGLAEKDDQIAVLRQEIKVLQSDLADAAQVDAGAGGDIVLSPDVAYEIVAAHKHRTRGRASYVRDASAPRDGVVWGHHRPRGLRIYAAVETDGGLTIHQPRPDWMTDEIAALSGADRAAIGAGVAMAAASRDDWRITRLPSGCFGLAPWRRRGPCHKSLLATCYCTGVVRLGPAAKAKG